MIVFEKDNIENVNDANYKWGEEKPKGNYKSVSIYGEAYDVGHCVQCNLESKETYIWKILKFFQHKDKKMCRIRRLFRKDELPQNIKRLDSSIKNNELFLASQKPNMQEDIPLEKIAQKFKIFCTFQDDDRLNPIPSHEQIKDADYFFHKGYDPTNEEIIALDGIVDELGAQYVYNKSWWFINNVDRPLSSQISGARIPSLSSASSLTAHQGATKAMHPFVLEVSPAPSQDSTKQRLKKRKSNSMAPEQEKNEFLSLKKSKVEKSTTSCFNHVVFAIPAPAFIDSLQDSTVLLENAKPLASISKSIQLEKNGNILKTRSAPEALIGMKQAKKKGGVNCNRKRDSEGVGNRTIKSEERSIAPSSTYLGMKQALNNIGKSVEKPRKLQEVPSKGEVKRAFKPFGRRSIASCGNLSKSQKRTSEDIGFTTFHCTTTTTTTTLSKKTKNLILEIPIGDENPNGMKMDRNFFNKSPQAPKEVEKIDVASRILTRDEDASNDPTTNQQQPDFPSLNVPSRKRYGFIAKDSCCLKSNFQESPKPTLCTTTLDRHTDITTSLLEASPQQKFERTIFKRSEDWDASLATAIQSQRILLFRNVDPELHSEDFSEALTECTKIRCEVRIAPPVSFSYQTTTALLKLPSFKKAQEFLEKIKASQLLVANRVVIVTSFCFDNLKIPFIKCYGHLDFSQSLRDQYIEDYKNVVVTSHLAQGNTIEFAYGLPWKVLDEQHEDQWRLLQEAHS